MTATMPRVLVVEDDAAMRALMTRQLRSKGFDVSEAEDAETVLNQPAPALGYDLVVADVHLPGQSGVELARHLRKGDANSRVVFVTGDHDESLAREALEEGAAGYLLKPFEFFELEAMVRAALKPVQTFIRRSGMGGRAAASQGRNVTSIVDDRRAFARWQEAVVRPEKVVMRQGRTMRKRPSLFGWKAIAAVAGSILLSWLTGSAVFQSESEAATLEPGVVVQQQAGVQPMFIPMVIEQKSYAPQNR
ncbi:MAG: response regulator [Gemmatimonadota bacterium]